MVTKQGDYTCTILFGYHIQSFFFLICLKTFWMPLVASVIYVLLDIIGYHFCVFL